MDDPSNDVVASGAGAGPIRRPAPGSLPLSVVVATSQGWPAIERCLDALAPSVGAVGAEVIVADGSAAPPPSPEQLPPGTRWFRRPSAGVLELRACAMQEARGAIIAVTEDHCLVAPDWCAQILGAHARHPDAVAIKGAVANGSRERLVDWAAFLLNQAPHLSPFVGRMTDAVLGVSSVSYAWLALERLAAREPGPVELRDYRACLATGARVVADEHIRVEHVQSVGFFRTSALQFHNARTVCGLRRARMTWRDWVRLAGAPILPFTRTLRTIAICLGKHVSRTTIWASVPMILWFYCCKGAGELLGYLAGPGQSPRKLL